MKIVDYYYDLRQKANEELTRVYGVSDGEKSWLKDAKILPQPLSFWNGGKIYFDDASLPPQYSSVTDLSNKLVLYGILCNGKFYVGRTKDFGERISTHAKDARNNTSSQMLYQDMATKGECLAFIFCTTEDEETLKQMERTLIALNKDYSIAKACNFDAEKIRFINESVEDRKEYSSKYCYNIAD